MKTIIVATDYSSTAENAVHYAANLAQVFQAELVLFNVFHPSIHVSNSLVSPEVIDHLLENNATRLQDLAHDTARQYRINVSAVSKAVDTVEALEDYTTAHPVDLVVMGMDSDLMEYKWFGNTTTAAIKRLRAPLLVVPNDISFDGIKKILYACEYTYLSEDNHLDLLKEITRKFAAELQILHVETKAHDPVVVDQHITAMDAIIEDVDHTYRFIGHSTVEQGIIDGVETWGADLLVMVPHRPGFWELLINGSATREVTLRTRVPLLVLPNAR